MTEKTRAQTEPAPRSRRMLWAILAALLLAVAAWLALVGWNLADERSDAPRADAVTREALRTASGKPVWAQGPPAAEPAPPRRPPPAAGHFRVAALQFASAFGELERNRNELAQLVRHAAGEGAQVVVMPEAAIPGYMSHDLQTAWRDPVRRPNPRDGRSLVEAGVAETVPGESTRYFGSLAKELRIHILATLIEKAERENKMDYYNTAVLLAPDGSIACHYRKLHPWPIGEATWAQPGDKGLGLAQTEFGTLGVLICFDLSNGVPEALGKEGASTLLYPIGWVCPNAPHWFDEMLPEKAKDWGVNVVGANWSLPREAAAQAGWHGYGHSRIIGLDGAILARGAVSGDGVLIADLPVGGRPLQRRP